MLATMMTFWCRRDTNGWAGIVAEHPNGSFSARAVPHSQGAHGVVQQTGIATLQEAEARADADVQAKAPHSCATQKCGGWPEQGT